jgi:hypothetical protein
MLGLALAVALLAALLVPLAGSSLGTVAADDEPVATEEATDQADGETQDPGDGGQGDDADTEGTETPIAEETPNTALQADPLTSNILVNMYGCNADQGNDFLQWSANCQAGGGFEFDVYGVGYNGQGTQQSAVDWVAVRNLPAGQYTIREWVPQGYYQPTVFCSRGPSDGNGTGLVEVVTYDGYFEFELGANESIYCHWFNVPRPQVPVAYGELWLYKMICPVDYGFDYRAAAQIDLQYKCELYDGNAVVFNLLVPANGAVLGQYIRPDVGAYVWKGAPAGEVTVTETNWTGGGTPIVFCYNAPFDGPSDWYKPAVSGSSADLEILNGVETVCHWFTVPLETGAVKIAASFCPEGVPFDYATADVVTLATYCDLYQGDKVGFDLVSQVSGETATRTTDPNNGGAATWEQVPVGGATVSERAQDGYGTPIVYCYYTDAPTEYLALAVQEWSAALEIRSGQTAVCDWFNVPASESGADPDGEDGSDPDGEGGSVIVGTYDCPAGTGYGEEYGWYANACTQPAEGVAFKLDGERTGNPGDKATDAEGDVYWGEREADRYYLSEEVPSGYGKPVLFCAYDDESLDPYAPDYTPDADPFTYRVEFDLDEGQDFGCYWFNIPADEGHDEYGSITIYKWLCPKDYDLHAPDADPRADCTETYDGVKFTIAGPEATYPYSYYDEQVTGDDISGGVAWEDLAEGDYSVEETVPEGISYQPVVICGDTYLRLNEPYTTFGLYELDKDVVCHWFNVPDAEDGDGVATVVTYACPKGTDLEGQVEKFQQTCTQTLEGVAFTLNNNSDKTFGEYPTDTDGKAAWTGLRADAYYLDEDLPTGYGRPVAFCDRYRPADGEQPYFQRYDVFTNESIQFDLAEGESIACSWFNIPVDDDVATVSINSHICPVGFDADGAGIFDLAANCQGFEAGLQFLALSSQGGPIDSQTTGDSFALGVRFDPLPAKDLVFSEQRLYGYGRPIVFCEVTDRQLQESGRRQATVEQNYEMYGDGYYFAWTLKAGDSLLCDWFDVPLIDSPDAGTLTVYEFVCPENGTDYDAADVETIEDTCELYEGNDVAFAYYNHTRGDTEPPYTGDWGYDTGATVVWAPTPAGQVTLTHDAKDGYGTPIVRCWATDRGQEFVEIEVEVEGRSADFAIPAGQHVLCSWYDIPEYDRHANDDGGKIVVTKWVCPEGYDAYDLDLAGLYETCDEVVSGVDFFLYGAATELQDATDGAGQVAFGPLPAGAYYLSEALPAGYGEPIVVCRLLVGNGAISYETATEFVAVGGQNEVGFGLELKSGTTWSCDWFNVPSSAGGGDVSVTIDVVPDEGQQALAKHKQTIVRPRPAA